MCTCVLGSRYFLARPKSITFTYRRTATNAGGWLAMSCSPSGAGRDQAAWTVLQATCCHTQLHSTGAHVVWKQALSATNFPAFRRHAAQPTQLLQPQPYWQHGLTPDQTPPASCSIRHEPPAAAPAPLLLILDCHCRCKAPPAVAAAALSAHLVGTLA